MVKTILKLAKGITNKILKEYGFRYDEHGNYRYYSSMYKSNNKTVIYAYFYVNIDENYFSYEIQSNGTTYYPYYHKDNKSIVNEIISMNISKEIRNLVKKGILEDEND